MMSTQNPQVQLQQLLGHCQSLQLATLTADGNPAISYAPFLQDSQGNFYIFISQLASHTQDLLHQRKAAVLLIADEHDTRQIFARTRASYDCEAFNIQRDAPEYQALLEAMQARFGEIVGLLRGLGDFMLFKLKPISGRFVLGFGQAFILTGDNLQTLQHIDAPKQPI
jgi:hypothetical protein